METILASVMKDELNNYNQNVIPTLKTFSNTKWLIAENNKRREEMSRWNSTSYLFKRQYPVVLVCGSGFVYSL